MTMATSGKKLKLPHCIMQREIGLGKQCVRAFNMKFMKMLITQESRTFEQVWETHSMSPIYYETGSNKIVTDKYQHWYTVNGINSQPSHLFFLESDTTLSQPNWKENIVDGLLCEFPFIHRNVTPDNHLFFALGRSSWLYAIDSYSGKVLQEIYLSRTYRYLYLSWNELAVSFVVKSTLSRRIVQSVNSRLVNFCIFNVCPFEFVAQFEVHRNVFGRDIIDAIINQNVLCVSHQSGMIKLYSLSHIFEEGNWTAASIGKFDISLNGVVGDFPDGLPMNVNLNSAPPVLFETKCVDNDLRMGGFPWHYIMTPLDISTLEFEVRSTSTNTLATNGILKRSSGSIYPDKAMFHPDESGRIIHTTSSQLGVYQLKTENEITTLCPCYKIKIIIAPPPKSTTTRSGRVVQNIIESCLRIDAFQQLLITFTYEDDLDVLVTLANTELVPYQQEQQPMTSEVCIYDNTSGKKLKAVPMKTLLDDPLENNIMMDLDIIVNIRKEANRSFGCYVYKLQSKDTE